MRLVGVAASVAALVLLAGCATGASVGRGHASIGRTAAPESSSTVTRSTVNQPRRPAVTVTVDQGCPAALHDATDVTASPLTPRDRLVPPSPQRALLCSSGTDAAVTLLRSVSLGPSSASRLATAANGPELGIPQGLFSCPEQAVRGAVTIAAFAYATGTVNLWWQMTGCQQLDNGEVLAFQGANPGFDAWQDTALALGAARTPWPGSSLATQGIASGR